MHFFPKTAVIPLYCAIVRPRRDGSLPLNAMTACVKRFSTRKEKDLRQGLEFFSCGHILAMVKLIRCELVSQEINQINLPLCEALSRTSPPPLQT